MADKKKKDPYQGRLGYGSGPGESMEKAFFEPWEPHVVSRDITTLKGIAEKSYGKHFKSVLDSRRRNQNKPSLISQIPLGVGLMLPDLSEKNWTRPIERNKVKGVWNYAGMTVATTERPFPDRMYVARYKFPDVTESHESTHVAQPTVQTEKLFTTNSMFRQHQFKKEPALPKKLEIEADKDPNLKYSTQPMELPAYITPVVRNFYKKFGRPVSSDEDVQKALDLEIERDPSEGDTYRFLKKIPYIGALGQLVVDRRKKFDTIG